MAGNFGGWIVMLGRMDLAHAVNAAPRTGHLKRAYWTFAYLKRRKHMAIRLDPCPPLIDHGSLKSDLIPDFSAIYPMQQRKLILNFQNRLVKN